MNDAKRPRSASDQTQQALSFMRFQRPEQMTGRGFGGALTGERDRDHRRGLCRIPEKSYLKRSDQDRV
jgi:hypothetical protein